MPFVPNPKLLDFAPGSAAHDAGLAFATNYTRLLVQLHHVFNGDPDAFDSTIRGMYVLSSLARGGLRTHDPRFPVNVTMGVGPVFEYVPSHSEYIVRDMQREA